MKYAHACPGLFSGLKLTDSDGKIRPHQLFIVDPGAFEGVRFTFKGKKKGTSMGLS
jgi:hypothetical protein